LLRGHVQEPEQRYRTRPEKPPQIMHFRFHIT
jgi:hypothetical protein